jgi:hypothetical protein
MFAASKTASVSGGYQISRSLRFNSADSAFLDRTPASSGNRRTWTWSGWVKKSVVGDGRYPALFGAVNSTRDVLRFNGESLNLFFNNTTSANLVTTAVYRDVSAWYHIVLAVDTTQATDTNRVKLYVNGVQVTAFSTASYPAQNYDTFVNMNVVQRIANDSNLSDGYFNGYMTEIYMVDGSQLTPSSFGETDTQTGVWKPKAYSGSYGTNGFYLNFSDNSNTTAATLGKDYSGNGNNWTPNNFSVTAGAGNDSLVDSPTSYGTDTGVGGTVRGNYATNNPLELGSVTTLTNGNLDVSMTGAVNTAANVAFGTISVTSGKWYWEVTPTTATNGMIGVSDANTAASTRQWQGANFWGYYSGNGNKYNNNSGTSYGSSYTTNDVIGVALDMDAGTVTFYKNGTSQGTAFSSFSGKTMQPALNNAGASTMTYTTNFGQRPFAYTAPSGYKALCTQNLPTPTIGATTATQAGKFFNPVLYTGNGGTQSITGVGFQPDMTWIKVRSTTYDHQLVDAVRGSGKVIHSNLTNAEATLNTVTSFNSDGFTVNGTTYAGTNGNGSTFVAWNWKANGSGSTNTAGSITSTVSANTTSGFSVVTYTGTGANATVGHGLGVAPSMVICKARTGTSVGAWQTYHSALGATKTVFLNLTDLAYTNSLYWNNTAPTSSVFSLGGNTDGNGSGYTMVAYCFAEVAGYSKFGSYTGNGSTNGTFVYCGFRPAYVMVKCTNTNGDWFIVDATRSPYNQTFNELVANSSGAEYTGTDFDSMDMLANGFKLRVTNNSANANGNSYIFMAFASAPQKFSLAR